MQITFPDTGTSHEIDNASWDRMSPEERDAAVEALHRRATIRGPEDLARGVGRGMLEGTAGAVETAGRGFFDLAQMAGAANNQLGGGELGDEPAVDMPKPMSDLMPDIDLASRQNHTADLANAALPAGDPDSLMARGGEVFGGLLGPLGVFQRLLKTARSAGVLPEMLGRSSTARAVDAATEAGSLRTMGGAAGTSAAAVGGGEAAVGLSGEESMRPVGELAGSVVAPAATRHVLEKGLSKMLPSPDKQHSGEIFDAQVAEGISPSAGSVGSSNAAYLETTATTMPPLGGRVLARQGNQVSRASDVLDEVTSDMRPAGARPAAGAADIGATLREGAQEGLEEIDNFLDGAEASLAARAGGATAPVRIGNTRSGGAALDEATATGPQKTALRGTLADVEADAAPIHQPAQNLLATELRARERQLKALGEPSSKAEWKQQAALQQTVDELRAKMSANEGVGQQKFRDARTNLGPRTQGESGLARKTSKQLYGDMTKDLEAHMAREGGPKLAREFNQLMALEKRLYAKKGSLLEGRDIEQLRNIVNKPDDTAIYRWIAEGQSSLPYEKFQLLRRNMSDGRWRKFSSDFVLRLGRARPGAQDATGEVFSPATFLTNWNRIDDPRLKQLLFPEPEWRERVERLSLISEGLKGKGNPSGTAMVAIPVGVAGQAMGTGGGDWVESTKRVAALVLGQAMFVSGLLDKRTAAAIAGRDPSFLTRLEQGAARSVGVPATAADQQSDE